MSENDTPASRLLRESRDELNRLSATTVKQQLLAIITARCGGYWSPLEIAWEVNQWMIRYDLPDVVERPRNFDLMDISLLNALHADMLAMSEKGQYIFLEKFAKRLAALLPPQSEK